MKTELNYYQILEVTETATSDEIKSAYRQLVQQYHPDKIPDHLSRLKEEAHERIKLINQAYEILSDSEKRKQYDFTLKRSQRGVSREITVCCSGFGDVETIAEALERAQDGDSISILPGVYKESLNIEKKVEINGYGESPDKVVLESGDSFCIRCRTTKFIIKNITIHQTNNDDENSCAIDVPMGQPTIQNCKIFSTSLLGIGISGTAAPLIEDCEVQLSQKGVAILVLQESSPTVQGCKIHDSEFGLLIRSSAAVHIQNNTIWLTKVAVRVDEYSHPTLKKNIIYGTLVGILVREKANGLIEENDLSAHAASAIEIHNEANPIIRSNTFHDGSDGSIALFVHEGARGLIEKNTLNGYTNSAFVHNDARPHIIENTVNGELVSDGF